MSLPTRPEDLEANLGYAINRLANLGQAAQARRLAASGLSLVLVRTLSVLHIEDGLTINEIAARTFADQSTASRTVEAMVAAGLVDRRTPPGDQRRREIVLTPAGRAALVAAWPRMEEHAATLARNITAADLETCRRVLAAMTANLRSED
ncbi:MarR family winged helix-turn-helix transcriptional regulator [Novosphingobium capsulatum]|uniref:MarR family winged helix-turn-helix transcriptional regulator n=1 Tax=Novosphingobium capsulatum TaxID=13688 RepID=UPI000787F5E7|nr:MarR family winged helix-turn-helix transcriptional regulator [Novosphingobium capsulatum]WQD94765.1 MarR family winged helix-turn-helix transcriptional regulator [Novosphingobium capsulatum]